MTEEQEIPMPKLSRCFMVVVVIGTMVVSTRSFGQKANVWLTTDNQRTKLKQQTAISFASGSSSSPTVFVDETQTYQSIEGFGASFTDSAAYLLNEKVPPSQLNSVMTSLFDHTNGIGVSFIRNPMGASDIARFDYSYDDMPAGQTDPALANFSIAHDQADIIPIILQAKQLNPKMKLMATPWSPPGWMKSTGSLIGGSLNAASYTAFANYFVKYLQAYEAAGVTVEY